jgi:hypothetical protein
MNTALIVGGDEITGIRRELKNHGIDQITHWSGRKVGDGNKVIPQDTQLIVLVTNWISHSFTKKIKLNASRRGVKVIYTPNGPAALRARLDRIAPASAGSYTQESDCRVYGQILTRLFGIFAPNISGVNHGNSIH